MNRHAETKSVVRALVASRVRVYREAIASALSQSPRLRVTATAADIEEILALLAKGPFDVVLVDTTIADSPQTVREMRRRVDDVKVVAVTLPRNDEDVIRLAEAGVVGYVLPDGSIEELIIALESAARGELHVSPQVAYRLLRRLGSLAHLIEKPANGLTELLTGREREIVKLIHQGLSNKAIATRLGIEVGTAKNHVQSILKKLHVHRRIEAAEWYRTAGFHLQLED